MGFHFIRNHIPANTVNWPADVQEIASKVGNKWSTNIGQNALFGSGVHLIRSEAYHLDTEGKTLDKGVVVAGNDSPVLWNGSATNTLPYEVSAAVTLFGYDPAQFVRDARRRRGRFYLPPFSATIMDGNTGRFSMTSLNSLKTNLDAFLNDIHRMKVGGGAPLEDDMKLCVLSKTGGLATPVQAWRMGDVPDAQRRRRRNQAEAFVGGAVLDQ